MLAEYVVELLRRGEATLAVHGHALVARDEKAALAVKPLLPRSGVVLLAGVALMVAPVLGPGAGNGLRIVVLGGGIEPPFLQPWPTGCS